MIKALGKVPGHDKCYLTMLGVIVITHHPSLQVRVLYQMFH